MKQMNKRAQAAMEFLMTYGWAILVVLIAIGALAYFGVLNPNKFLPQSCTLSPGLSCIDFAVYSDGVVIKIANGMGSDLNSLEVGVENCMTASMGINYIGNLPNGKGDTYMMFCQLTAGSRFKEDIFINYIKDDGSLVHEKVGTIIAKVENMPKAAEYVCKNAHDADNANSLDVFCGALNNTYNGNPDFLTEFCEPFNYCT